MTSTNTATQATSETAASVAPAAPTASAGEQVERKLSSAGIRLLRETVNCSRKALSELTGLPTSRIWAAEQDDKVITDEHYLVITAVLDNVQRNGLPPHLQPKQATPKTPKAKEPTALEVELAERLVNVSELLNTALVAKSLKETRSLIEQAQAVAYGTTETEENSDSSDSVNETNSTENSEENTTETKTDEAA